MFKQIKKLTALFFVAATMFTFASCNKDNNEDNPSNPSGGGSSSSISESQLIGLWGFPAGHQFQGWELDIKADHTMTHGGTGTWTWSLNGNKFVAEWTVVDLVYKLVFNIQSVTPTEIKFNGEYQTCSLNGDVRESQDISSTLTNLLIDPSRLSEVIVGEWSNTWKDMLIYEDGTCNLFEFDCNWSVSGAIFTATSEAYNLVFEAKRIKIHNNKVTMTVEGTETEWGSTREFNRTITKTM